MRKSRGQSLVEVAIAFPVLIVMLSGVIEFGFILNYYLSLLDATRESARYWSGDDPYCHTVSPTCPLANGSDDPDFYYQTALTVRKQLDPSLTYDDPTDYHGRRIVLNPAVDDVIVSVFAAKDNTVTLVRDAGAYHLFPTPGNATGNYPSVLQYDDPAHGIHISPAQAILNTRIPGAPNAGILLVEVHYNYHHVLSLPWLTVWLPNPLHLRAYTIMPIRSGEPP